ncbi:hypothetical protein [Nitratireductor luteus]|uniref:hypothetical protein n=1 Tax=Nitratireductor luteus TaxID=2976980 RepID=UPI0022401783|nr:hypothetical protein [Nitratireductor luteus]
MLHYNPAEDRQLDAKIAPYVEVLRSAGIETFESCEGGDGHAYPEPTIRFYGDRSEGYRALAVAMQNGLPVAEHVALFVIDCMNIVIGHTAFLALGWWTLPPTERRGFFRIVCLTPAYWLIMSAAAWRAIWQLYRNPHHWEKTPHPPRQAFQPGKSAPDATIFPSSSPIASRSRAA